MSQKFMVLPLAFIFFLATVLPVPSASLEQAILGEINRARTEPGSLVGSYEQFRTLFHDKFWIAPGSPVRNRTQEGAPAVSEAIAFLRVQTPLPSLQWSESLAAAARELAEAQSASGTLGHGSGSSSMEARLDRHGRWLVAIGENVTYGSYGPDQAFEIVRQTIIDDGVPGRGHRANLFAPEFALVGIACAPHPKLGTVCVFDFAGGME